MFICNAFPVPSQRLPFECVFVCSCMCIDITTGNIHSYITSENQIHIHMTLLTLNDLMENIAKVVT